MPNSDINLHLSVVTQALIEACGGFIAAALECDVSKSQLERAANPNHSYTLKASTIWHLEQACGQAIMSRTLYEMSAFEACGKPQNPLILGIDFAHSATDFTVGISNSLQDGKLTTYEVRTLTGRTEDIQRQLSELRSSLFTMPTGPIAALEVVS